MNKLIKLQLRNLFHNKLFYVCLGLTLLLSPILSFIFYMTKISPTSNYQVFPQIIDFMSSEVGLVSSIFIALFACFDFNEGTTKNIIARGYTRTKLLLSKYIVSLIGLFTMYVVAVLVTFILFFNCGIGFDSKLLLVLVVDIVGIIAYTIFFATLAFVLEKNSSAIIGCLFAPRIFSIAITLIDSSKNLYIGLELGNSECNIGIINQNNYNNIELFNLENKEKKIQYLQ